MTTILDDETLNLYVEESKEHLETIETDLLELEKQGTQFDEELVNKVFRAAHSIKGGGGFLGLNNIKELAHKIENILHMVRTNQMVPNPELINILLNAYDRLGELIDNPGESNEMDISDHLEKLGNAISVNLADDEKPSLQTKLVVNHPKLEVQFEVREFDLKQAQQGGKHLYILDIDLIKDIHRQKKTPFEVITLLEESGSIVDIATVVTCAGDLGSDEFESAFPMCVLFASIVEPDLISVMFNLEDSKVNVITNEKIKPHQPDQQVNSPTPVVESEVVEEAPVENTPAPVVREEKENIPQEPVVQEQTSTPPVQPENPSPKTAEPSPNPPKEPPVKIGGSGSETLRVNVAILDQLMNRAGELVLARNQMVQALNSWDKQQVTAAGQRVSLVTSELQETIMLTRMQPVGIVFNKFPRLVRGLAMDLNKKMELNLEGTEVELDKTIIEGLADPLTHLVRNSADHGIESPQDREKKGKPALGKILLRAFYESGQVLIEIKDDGKGLHPGKIAEKAVSKGLYSQDEIDSMSEKEKLNLIMLPGFSTAEKVTDVSGRGVGMDVVKTNLDQLGGQVELISEVDIGTTIRIKLPLTLAIIPSLLVQSADERFAIPQANVGELLRIPAAEIRERIEKVGDADVLILRGELIPLLQLNNILEQRPTFYDATTGTFKEDRRKSVADQRLLEIHRHKPSHAESDEPVEDETDKIPERRTRRESDAIIAILSDGSQKYGLVVDAVFDSVEIVVKPLGRHLNKCLIYAGATIMGDGHVALILDVHGIAEKAELKLIGDTGQESKTESEEAEKKDGATRQTLLIFHNGPNESCAVPLEQVLRVEKIKADDIELKGGKKIIKYRGGSLTVYALEEVASVDMLEARDNLIVIIFDVAGNEIGLLAVQPLDVVDENLVLDDRTLRQQGIAGSTIINGQTTLLVDIYELVQIVNPHWFNEIREAEADEEPEDTKKDTKGEKILLAEDSQFFRNQVTRFLEECGYVVVEAEDGQEAWDYMVNYPEDISIVVTDLEMPNMDGFELTKHIKNDDRFAHLPVIALTSLASDDDLKRGKEVGIDDYQIKLDKDKLRTSIKNRFK